MRGPDCSSDSTHGLVTLANRRSRGSTTKTTSSVSMGSHYEINKHAELSWFFLHLFEKLLRSGSKSTSNQTEARLNRLPYPGLDPFKSCYLIPIHKKPGSRNQDLTLKPRLWGEYECLNLLWGLNVSVFCYTLHLDGVHLSVPWYHMKLWLLGGIRNLPVLDNWIYYTRAHDGFYHLQIGSRMPDFSQITPSRPYSQQWKIWPSASLV
ncbi:hypothetical protein F4778DRAFT_702857 [Xylariomycetidae sp. FL2044]|nr:hypothetical protein F4778DRAFT_702857 [Xylariomycetidae sp. FL2044]